MKVVRRINMNIPRRNKDRVREGDHNFVLFTAHKNAKIQNYSKHREREREKTWK